MGQGEAGGRGGMFIFGVMVGGWLVKGAEWAKSLILCCMVVLVNEVFGSLFFVDSYNSFLWVTCGVLN